MEKLNKVIFSKGSKTGVAIQIFGVVCFFAAIPLLHTSTKSNSPALYLFFAGFFSFSILLWVIGSYQRRKFSKLSKTPITLNPSVCTIGDEFKGSIEITKPDFNSVKEISITLWQRRKIADDEYRNDIVWESSATPNIIHVDGKTILDFSFVIPHDKEPTNQWFFSKNKYFWELEYIFFQN